MEHSVRHETTHSYTSRKTFGTLSVSVSLKPAKKCTTALFGCACPGQIRDNKLSQIHIVYLGHLLLHFQSMLLRERGFHMLLNTTLIWQLM